MINENGMPIFGSQNNNYANDIRIWWGYRFTAGKGIK